MRRPSRALTIARFCGSIDLGFTVAYLLFAVLPFYGNGIHLRSYQEIAGSLVDVKGYPPFVWFLLLQGVALLAGGLTPMVSVALTPVLLLLLAVKWRSVSRTEMAAWLAIAVLNVASLVLTWGTLSIIMT